MSHETQNSSRPRERSARYPGTPLGEAIEFCRRISEKGADGLPVAEIATALGYSNIRTNNFSARLSAARQFGLLAIVNGSCTLTARVESILQPVDPSGLPHLHGEAFLEPPLYQSLAQRLGGKTLPDIETLANWLYHQGQITRTAKRHAAEVLLESARFAGMIDAQNVFRPYDAPTSPGQTAPPARLSESSPPPSIQPPTVRIDLRLWGQDEGKIIRIRAPESLSRESLDRIIAALRLHLKIDENTP